MISLLSKWLIHDNKNYTSPDVRIGYGVLCGAVGIGLNILLFIGKIIAAAVISMIGFRLSRSKADKEHPFGHGRFEYIAGLVVSFAILFMGVELAKSSIGKIISPEPVTFSVLTVCILSVAILVKLYMFFYNSTVGKKIDSATMRATARDSLSDVVATSAVLLTTIASRWTDLPLDGWAGLAVALFILYSGVMAAKETISPLLGQPPDEAFVRKVTNLVLEDEQIVGVHDLVVHDYGPGRLMVSLHAEVPADGDMLLLHDAVDNIERRLQRECGCEAVIHMDPVVLNDAETNRLRAEVEEIVHALDERLSVHDFRTVPGNTHTNLVFDVVVPYEFGMTDEQVRKEVLSRVQQKEHGCFAVVQIDKSLIK
jgi:cation diffusion facilitator family transporter